MVTVLIFARSLSGRLNLLFRSRTDPFDKLRSEFRPLDCMQSIFLTCLTLVQRKHCLFDGDSASGLGWCLVVFLVVLFGCFACFLFSCYFTHHQVVFPFLSMMTWAHRPHGVRTRAKKKLLVCGGPCGEIRCVMCHWDLRGLGGKCVCVAPCHWERKTCWR